VLHYIATKPKELTAVKPAVLIVIHGYGADEHDLLPLAERLPGNFLIISLRAPLTLPWGGFAWYHLTQTATGAIRGDDLSRQKSEKLLTAELSYIIRKEGGDLTNVTLMGFSQGAALIYALLSRHDLAGLGIKTHTAICLSGYIPKDCSFAGKEYKGLKMFMSHGKLDELIAPIALDEASRIMKQTGADVTMNLYPIGHGISETTIDDIATWMLSERLNP
jgi:phospholipase/carboxylesterase